MSRERARRRAQRANAGGTSPVLPLLANPYAPIEILSADQVEAIHEASLRILEELGMDIWSDEALDILAAAGAEVDRPGRHVRLDRGLVTEAIAKAPAEFTLHARNPARNVRMGGNFINFGLVGGPAHATDLDRGRRPGTYADACDLIRLAQALDVLHIIGGAPVAPIDLPVATRHLDTAYAVITLTDRVWHASALGRQRVEDAVAMLAIARGLDREAVTESPGLVAVVNANSPLRYDGAMLDGAIAVVRAGQGLIVTPFTLAGAMSPVTIAGALAQQNAEALAGIALAQIVRPGAPVVYGGFTSNVDMKSGAPAFGTPEYAKAVLAGGQLARRYRLPYRSSNVNACNVVDAQAAYESEMSLWATVMGHCNYVLHAAGWLEGGLTASFEKMVVDAEMLRMMAAFLKPLEVSEETLAFDAMREVGPGGHFFGAAHTLARYETAFYSPLLSDWRNFETWEEAGAQTATMRANGIWKAMLAAYQPPPIDPGIDEALKDYVARRKREGGIGEAA